MCTRNRPCLQGFTLVELLVVVTIIVLLLALLSPALSRAVYRAQLTTCATQLRGIGMSVTAYASENRRHYPDRGLSVNGPDGSPFGSDQQAILKYHEVWSSYRPIDQRIVLRKALSDLNKQLNDPLTGTIDMDSSQANWVFAPYNLWWGFSYIENGSRMKTMLRIGDRWSCNPYGQRGAEFSVLAGDRDQISPDPNVGDAQSSHPDGVHNTGIMFNRPMQDQVAPWIFATGTITFSLWWTEERTDHRRGLVDNNFVMNDLSIRMLDRVHWDHGRERRLKPVGIFSSNPNTGPPGTGRYQYVP